VFLFFVLLLILQLKSLHDTHVCGLSQEYAEKLKDSGVHGAVLVLDVNFTADMFANLLAIPSAKSYVRRHLVTEYDAIIQPARCARCQKQAWSNTRRENKG